VFVGVSGAGHAGAPRHRRRPQHRPVRRNIPVRVRIHTINGFSEHADRPELVDWYHRIDGNKTTFLVHGEPGAMAALALHLGAPSIAMPELHQAFVL